MTTQDLALLQAAAKKMQWHETRQKVLAQNIANADTAGYRPQDLTPMDFRELLQSSTSSLSLSGAVHPATTNPQHLSSSGTSATAVKPVVKDQKNPYESSPSGNSVVLEEQLLKMNQNYTDHRLTTTIYQKNVDMLKMSTR